jgi:hypothetical protein
VKVSDKYLLDLLREVVSIRAGGRCEYPGCCETSCDPHHWYSKKNLSIRYDPDACLYLCAEHHTGGTYSAHRSPELFKNKIISSGVRSQEWADSILIKKNKIIVCHIDDFREDSKEILIAERLAA